MWTNSMTSSKLHQIHQNMNNKKKRVRNIHSRYIFYVGYSCFIGCIIFITRIWGRKITRCCKHENINILKHYNRQYMTYQQFINNVFVYTCMILHNNLLYKHVCSKNCGPQNHSTGYRPVYMNTKKRVIRKATSSHEYSHRFIQ